MESIMSDIQATVQDLINLLEMQKSQIIEDIRNYPPPIPACDAQFNYLLEKRDRLTVDLNRLRKLHQDDEISERLVQGLLHFMANSTVIDRDTEQSFRLRLQASQY
jgi:hypothetical protein